MLGTFVWNIQHISISIIYNGASRIQEKVVINVGVCNIQEMAIINTDFVILRQHIVIINNSVCNI